MKTQDLDGSNMSNKKVVILNGIGSGDDCFDSPFSELMDLLNHDNADVSVIPQN